MTSLPDQIPPRRRFKLLRRPLDSIRPATPRPQRKDCQGQLIAALEEMIGEAGRIEQATLRPWCSATFIGAQHRLMLRLGGPDAAQHSERLSASLPDAAFKLRGHIVADLTVDAIRSDADDVLIDLAALTIEDW